MSDGSKRRIKRCGDIIITWPDNIITAIIYSDGKIKVNNNVSHLSYNRDQFGAEETINTDLLRAVEPDVKKTFNKDGNQIKELADGTYQIAMSNGTLIEKKNNGNLVMKNKYGDVIKLFKPKENIDILLGKSGIKAVDDTTNVSYSIKSNSNVHRDESGNLLETSNDGTVFLLGKFSSKTYEVNGYSNTCYPSGRGISEDLATKIKL